METAKPSKKGSLLSKHMHTHPIYISLHEGIREISWSFANNSLKAASSAEEVARAIDLWKKSCLELIADCVDALLSEMPPDEAVALAHYSVDERFGWLEETGPDRPSDWNDESYIRFVFGMAGKEEQLRSQIPTLASDFKKLVELQIETVAFPVHAASAIVAVKDDRGKIINGRLRGCNERRAALVDDLLLQIQMHWSELASIDIGELCQKYPGELIFSIYQGLSSEPEFVFEFNSSLATEIKLACLLAAGFTGLVTPGKRKRVEGNPFVVSPESFRKAHQKFGKVKAVQRRPNEKQ